MAFGEKIALVELEPRACGSVQQSGVHCCCAPTRADDPGTAGSALRQMPVDQALHFALLHPGCDHRHAVGNDPACTLACTRAERAQLGCSSEIGEIFEVLRTLAAHDHAYTRSKMRVLSSSGWPSQSA